MQVEFSQKGLKGPVMVSIIVGLDKETRKATASDAVAWDTVWGKFLAAEPLRANITLPEEKGK